MSDPMVKKYGKDEKHLHIEELPTDSIDKSGVTFEPHFYARLGSNEHKNVRPLTGEDA
jgi:hypothetical protein